MNSRVIIEACDPRVLLASVTLSSSGLLTVDGSKGFPIDVTVEPSGSKYVVHASGQQTRSFAKFHAA